MVWSQISVHIRPANKCLARCCEVLTSLFPLLSDGVQFQLRLQPFTWHPKRQMRKDHRKVYDIEGIWVYDIEDITPQAAQT